MQGSWDRARKKAKSRLNKSYFLPENVLKAMDFRPTLDLIDATED